MVMMGKPARCPVCNAPMIEDRDSCFKPPPECPYKNISYPELCSLHDKIYFGKWRKMSATPYEVRRAKRKIERLIFKVNEVSSCVDVEQARANIRKALESLEYANVKVDPFEAVKYMDRALSFVHHAVNDFLHTRGEKGHNPADYEQFYDIILPFKEDW